jgi:hypothetical protein
MKRYFTYYPHPLVRNSKAGVTIPDAGTDISVGPLCVYAIVLAFILFIIFLIYVFYFRKYGLKKGKKHRCNYCGQLVGIMSDCHHAPVTEQFLIGVCQSCGKECKLLCTQCGKPIMR